MDYDINDILLLLVSIKKTDLISDYLFENLGSLKIAKICEFALENNYIINNNGTYSLTSEGENYIEKLNKELKKKGIDKWIVIPSNYKIDKISLEYIYLPNKIWYNIFDVLQVCDFSEI